MKDAVALSTTGAKSDPLRATHQRRDIQGLRAVAVLIVVAFHAGLPLPGGFVGVDVFFVISGFVITRMLEREWTAHGRVRLRHFYWRRFKRLTPALALTVGVTVVVSAFVLSPLGTQQSTAVTGLGALALSANIVIARTTGGYFDAPAETNALLNTWSLSVEEQFYLVFPLVLLVGWRLARRGRRVMPVALVVTGAALSFALAAAGSRGTQLGLPPRLEYLADLLLGFYSPATRAWEFAAGALLALVGTRRFPTEAKADRWAGVAGATALVSSLWLITEKTPFPGPWSLLPVFGTMLLIWAGRHGTSVVTRFLSTGPMVWIGDLSYSIYLWHWPVIVAGRALWGDGLPVGLLAATLSLLPAIASYYLVEQPVRVRTVHGRSGAALLIATTLVPPVVLASGLVLAANRGFWMAPVRDYQSAIRPDHLGEAAGCSASLPWEQLTSCTWNSSADGPAVYLVGDSHADAYGEAVVGAGRLLGRPVVNLAVNGCAFSSRNRAGSLCDRVATGVGEYLSTAEPGTVVIANISSDGGLESMVRELHTRGHQVVLAQSVPMFDGWRPDTCSVPTIVQGHCLATQPALDVRRSQARSRTLNLDVAEETGATVLDPLPDMCPDGVCSTEGPDLIRYRDSDHISVAQSSALAPLFQRAIETAALRQK